MKSAAVPYAMNTFCPGVVSWTIFVPFARAPTKISCPSTTSKISAPMAEETKEVRMNTTFTLSGGGGLIVEDPTSVIKVLTQPPKTDSKAKHERLLNKLAIWPPIRRVRQEPASLGQRRQSVIFCVRDAVAGID